ncbi:hypothetical protein [Propioniciclava soli]|uniref:hypothetical protein n=1 Tax=Propioniciclava soli TaxID=2775081 RepID=UPI001E38DE8D|nr:hypothetical protein [Propioniciclava soli]
MGMLRSSATWLGLTSPPLLPGFKRSGIGDRQPYCLTCGAVIAWEGQQRHQDWHRRP